MCVLCLHNVAITSLFYKDVLVRSSQNDDLLPIKPVTALNEICLHT